MTSRTSASPSDIPTTTAVRILCIHENESNASELKKEFNALGNKLFENHAVDLVYVNGPLIASTTSTITTDDRQQKCVWWEEIDKADEISMQKAMSSCGENSCEDSTLHMSTNAARDDENIPNQHKSVINGSHINLVPLQQQNQVQYRGLDASLMLLRQIWTSCPFWGIIGVGEGAAMASLFVTFLESEALSSLADTSDGIVRDSEDNFPVNRALLPPTFPQLIILISGKSLIPVDAPLLGIMNLDNQATTPYILHLVDCSASPEQELLMRQFPHGCQIEHRQDRSEPTTHLVQSRQHFSSHDLNVIGRFICQRKKDLYTKINGGNSHHEILALQTALHIAEQDASNCIAETIVLNPPAALMAVIRPQTVAGWKGNRRAQPEGGGAPCPEEFLHKNRRTSHVTSSTTSSGSSNIHHGAQ
jgi:Serine hydrolase (FSH1)